MKPTVRKRALAWPDLRDLFDNGGSVRHRAPVQQYKLVDRSALGRLARLRRYGLIIIDEVGYSTVDRPAPRGSVPAQVRPVWFLGPRTPGL